MIITKYNLQQVSAANLITPNENLLNLPERVLQFGTGVLLRGLPDFFIDNANRNGKFNGRIAVVKSTSKGDLKDFEAQDSLYTICVRGIANGAPVEENIISSSISRVLSAEGDWETILSIAKQPEVRLIVSNTTEVGIVFVEEDIFQSPPKSFPAKLLAALYARYDALGSTEEADIVVIATELIPDNGKKLASIVDQLIAANHLNSSFIEWLKKHVHFCNSLVDRIVPGKPDEKMLSSLETQLGYQDNLLIMAEPYRLWAIEGDEQVAKLIGLTGTDHGIIIKPDIEIYRELKVRLLNGSHTLTSGLAHLSGISTVANALNDDVIKDYITALMDNEIVPAIPYAVKGNEAIDFAKAVLDRFANPYIEHLWLNITFQYAMKMKIRIVPVLLQYYKLYNKVPQYIAFGFSAFLVFIKANRKEGDAYYGTYNGSEYVINDDNAAYFFDLRDLSGAAFIKKVLADEQLWGKNLTELEGFAETVEENYHAILKNGIKAALSLIK